MFLDTVFFISSVLPVMAQNVNLSTNPPAVKWAKIKTPDFKVYFDKKIGDEGQYVANLLQNLYTPVSYSLGIKPGKIPVILQNQTVISNGFVSETPLRSEFYMYPPQNYNVDGLLKWTKLLSVHEFRHVVQFNKSLTGFNKFVFTLFGYEAAATLSHLAVPDWFWEGDAVLTETNLTNYGRGRDPYFSVLMKTNMLERGPFNYYLQYLRSFRYNIPDHYVTGYYLTSYLRRKYGAKTISTVLQKTWSLPFMPFRFSHELKKFTGKNLVNNYQAMTHEIDSLWKSQLNKVEVSNAQTINKRINKLYTDYKYPQYLPDGNIFALKTGINDISSFIEIDSAGNERKIFTPGAVDITGFPTTGGGKIAWTEVEYDPRWEERTYSVIKIYNIHNNTLKRVSRATRYSSSGISPDGKKIVTLRTTTDLKYNLLILDAGSGRILETIDNPGNFFFLTPTFSADGNKIVAVQKSDEGKSIWVYDMSSKESRIVYGPVEENFGNPYMISDYIFYNSPVSGIDNIYMLDTRNHKIFQVTSRKYGAYNSFVSENRKKVLFNDFTVDGMDVASIDFIPEQWKDIDEVVKNPIHYFQPVESQEMTNNVFENLQINNYKISKANRFGGIFNPYGWGLYLTGTDLNFLLGIHLQDILSTTAIDAGYEINANESTGKWTASVSYQGLYPVINVSAYTGKRSVTETFTDTTANATTKSSVNVNWNESGFTGGLALPLNLTHSRYIEYLNLSAYSNYSHISGYNYYRRNLDQQGNGTLIYNTYKIQYQRMLVRSKRDVNSKFAQLLFLQYSHTPFGGDYNTEMFSGEGRFIFPGIIKHHSLNLRVGFVKQDISQNENSYWLSSPIFYPRGYSYRPYENFLITSANYLFPVCYPDLHLGPWINIQRIYANLFIDNGIGKTGSDRDRLTSTGLELYFDVNLMRYLPLYEFGLRYSYSPVNNRGVFQFLIANFGL